MKILKSETKRNCFTLKFGLSMNDVHACRKRPGRIPKDICAAAVRRNGD